MKKLFFGLFCISAVCFGAAEDSTQVYEQFEEYEEASGPYALSSTVSAADELKSSPSPPISSSESGFMRRSPGLQDLSKLAAEEYPPRSDSAPPTSAAESRTHMMKRSPGQLNLSQWIVGRRSREAPGSSAICRDVPLTPEQIRAVSQFFAPIPVRPTNPAKIGSDVPSSTPAKKSEKEMPAGPLTSAADLFDSSTGSLNGDY